MIEQHDQTAPPALGAVVEEGRGSLPFALIHGEALVACAAWALGEAGVTAVDLGTGWAEVVESGEPFVLHDALCPMTPPSFIAECLVHAVERDVVVVARGAGGAVASPVVLPPSVVAALDGPGSLDLAELATDLRVRFGVDDVAAPGSARRVASVDDVRELEAVTAPRAAG